jgi:transketolase
MATKAEQRTDIDELCINTIRTLSMDAIQKANSGHPGTPMALAPLAYTLWQRNLRFDPQDPIWPNRDRFVLSAGHASMLLYSLLFLAGVKAVDPDYEVVGQPAVSLDDIKAFRQLDSKCPGHPEYRWTSGVETTTGPLGQGIATSVGMAVASAWQAAYFNSPDTELFDFDVYAIAGDGCLMEGVSNEAASFAGHQRLSNLCWVYDNNHISIDGHTSITYSDDVQARFEGYQWNVTRIEDANNLDEIARAFDNFREEPERPTLIIIDSHIGYGAPNKQDTAEAHGEPLGDEEVRETKRFYGWPEDEEFLVPDGVREHFAEVMGKRGAELSGQWKELFESYRADDPEKAAHWEAMQRRELPEGWDADIPSFEPDEKGLATRKASNKVENAVAARVPWFVAGAADLTGSNSVELEGSSPFEPDSRDGRQFHYGIREHESAAISNGLSLSKMRPLWSTYLTFSDYARPAIRLSSLMELPVIHLFTHDSIGLGEDGPTHQPVEHHMALRAIPNFWYVRPGDANETTIAWRIAMERRGGPVGLALTRQKVPTLDRHEVASAEGVLRGAYTLWQGGDGEPDLIVIATGSELGLAFAAAKSIANGAIVRVVSMPCWELFEEQGDDYREEVLPASVRARVSVEAGITHGWERWIGEHGRAIGVDRFGASAPYERIYEELGLTPERIVAEAEALLTRVG